MKKSTLIMILSLIMAVAVGMGSTVAYLQDTDEDVNVMTLGNVKIEQIEKERIEQSDDNVSPDNIQDFTQGKPLYPVVGTNDWAENNQQWPTGGSSQMHNDELKNVVDKFVFVENTGKSDAYVRTIFAFEAGELTFAEWDKMMHWNINGVHWDWNGFEAEEASLVTIDGNKYFLVEALYLGNAGTNQDVHKDGILAPGETTRPSLLQFWMDWEANNETMEAIDGNGNGTYDILVVSQAVQTMGFADAQTALDTAFGDVTANSHPWMKEENGGQPPYSDKPEFPVVVSNQEELVKAFENLNADIVLADDIDLTGEWKPIGDKEAEIYFTGTLDGAGYAINGLQVSSGDYAAFIAAMDGGTVKNLTVNGTVTADNAAGIVARMESGLIENCVNNANVTGNKKAGGIVCLTNVDGAVIRHCVNNGNIEGNASGGSGGIVAYANATTVIENCENTGNIAVNSTATYAGGIIGYATSNVNSSTAGSDVVACKNSGSVKASNSAGGIIGIATGSCWSIVDCENTADNITANTAGAILGNQNGGIVVDNCTNTAASLKLIGNK